MMGDVETYAIEREIERDKQDNLRNELAIKVEKENYANYLKESFNKMDFNSCKTVKRLDIMPWYERWWHKVFR